jgi:hypothetical protein
MSPDAAERKQQRGQHLTRRHVFTTVPIILANVTLITVLPSSTIYAIWYYIAGCEILFFLAACLALPYKWGGWR